MGKIKHLLQILTCSFLLLAIAINKEQKVFNIPVSDLSTNTNEVEKNIWITNDGYKVISTKNIAKDIFGFAGNIPLLIYLKDNKVSNISVQQHTESEEFFSSVINNGLLNKWNGLSLEEAKKIKVDAVSGATMSSTAIIESVDRALLYESNEITTNKTMAFKWNNISFWIILIVVLSAMFIPIFYKNKRYRNIQLIMNVIILGFWGGNFVSISLLVNFFSNGFNILISIIPILLLITAFLFPLFGKKGHYCAWVCPMGSLQELLGRSIKYKIKIKPKTLKYLDYGREAIWLIVLSTMLIGITFDMMNYEVFSAFLFTKASIPVLIISVIFMVSSLFIQRPYCRFICPTGSILKFSQQINAVFNLQMQLG